ncbi:MAG: hypothetical protein JW829_14550 [Pirellulales bacterium]|nr:hypothetical protein [Pirellulales bacterium]
MARVLKLGRGGVKRLRKMTPEQIAKRSLLVELEERSNTFLLPEPDDDSVIPDGFFDYRLFFGAINRKRHIHFFAGPTNSGKTWHAHNELAKGKRGIYLAPLRLLALEGQEELTRRGVSCSLLTGEEQDILPGATHTAATIEMLDPQREYDVAVIDEIQMLCDESRGHSWTRALFGVRAGKILLTGQTEVIPLVERLAEEANVTLEITHHKRLVPLEIAKKPIADDDLTEVPPGSAIVGFSRRMLHELRNRLHAGGRRAALIYGPLGPHVRRKEARRFREGKAHVLLATDAIGMGLNLPIQHLYFYSLKKFDGNDIRYLTNAEIRQIGGRAGRFSKNGDGSPGVVSVVGADISILEAAFAENAVKTDDYTAAWAGPTIEHLDTLSRLMGSDRLTDVLDFFTAHVSFSSSNLQMAKLGDIRKNARTVDAVGPSLSIDAKWQLACAPVSTGRDDLDEQQTYRLILEAVQNNQTIALDKACPPPVNENLLNLETWVKQLTLYIWTAFRFEKNFPERAAAEALRNTANHKIIQLLSSGKAVNLPEPVRSYSRIDYHSWEDDDEYWY